MSTRTDFLSQSKMLYEIYQLKVSLNLTEDSDDEELEEFIHAHKFNASSASHATGIKPPTPPKILNEDKVYEKLESYRLYMGGNRKSSRNSSRKSVILVDANPELLITEKDVLLTLMEMNIDARRAQQICKSLYLKSKDTVIQHNVEVGTKRLVAAGSANRTSQYGSKELIDPSNDIRGNSQSNNFDTKAIKNILYKTDRNKKHQWSQAYLEYSLKSDRKCICPEARRNVGSSDIEEPHRRENPIYKFLTLKACRGGIPNSLQSEINTSSKRTQSENGLPRVDRSIEDDESVRHEKKGNSRISWTKPIIENEREASLESLPSKQEGAEDSKIIEAKEEDIKDVEGTPEDKTIQNESSIANGGDVRTDTIEYEESLESDSEKDTSVPEISEEELSSESRSKSSTSRGEKKKTKKLKRTSKEVEDSTSGEENSKEKHKSQSTSDRPGPNENQSDSNVSEVSSELDSNE